MPTAELIDALDVEATPFGRGMADLGCHPTRERVPHEDGSGRQVRGYYLADIPAQPPRQA